uniref:Uncharacterized protein n=1 Tax=Candidatus Kentrum eta TaxID=2126337 RepID=A0A450UJW2_9GAMM|nr:MAG: hypothetical protein BECKH772A_GA0070896_1000835 [Candidatus Kentron sp. H]VFJ92836.1 MAG: hypothetical protein BECKH772B_GA0070898_1003416 [Candidatus Kentron sp. H]VFJ94799.1 MAG: hypothetical protein BECKH772C_GA0070978_1000115 [Candidatus Kentron sp. H]
MPPAGPVRVVAIQTLQFFETAGGSRTVARGIQDIHVPNPADARPRRQGFRTELGFDTGSNPPERTIAMYKTALPV